MGKRISNREQGILIEELFPNDFMFQLTKKEWQEVITNCDNLTEEVKFSPSLPLALWSMCYQFTLTQIYKL